MAEDLYNLLKSMGLEQYFEVFVANDIDVSLAQDLNDQDLIELGLSIGQRKRYRRAIEAAGSAAKSSRLRYRRR